MAVFCLILDMCSFLFSLLSYARGMVRRKKKRYSRSLVDLHVVCFDAELKSFADRLKDYVSHRLQRWYPLTSPTSQLAASISQLAGSRLWSLSAGWLVLSESGISDLSFRRSDRSPVNNSAAIFKAFARVFLFLGQNFWMFNLQNYFFLFTFISTTCANYLTVPVF